MTTFIYKIKCMACGLHFEVLSWHANWEPNHCPECGTTYPFMLWRDETDRQIFELVPGSSELIEMGAGRKPVA